MFYIGIAARRYVGFGVFICSNRPFSFL